MFFSILDYERKVLKTGRNTHKENWKEMANEMYEILCSTPGGIKQRGISWDWRTITGKVECITDPGDSTIIVHNKPFPDYYDDEDYINMIKLKTAVLISALVSLKIFVVLITLFSELELLNRAIKSLACCLFAFNKDKWNKAVFLFSIISPPIDLPTKDSSPKVSK